MKTWRIYTSATALCAALVLFLGLTTAQRSTAQRSEGVELRVALFPYVPDPIGKTLRDKTCNRPFAASCRYDLHQHGGAREAAAL